MDLEQPDHIKQPGRAGPGFLRHGVNGRAFGFGPVSPNRARRNHHAGAKTGLSAQSAGAHMRMRKTSTVGNLGCAGP